jgi:uncharacterized membrane protein YgcG
MHHSNVRMLDQDKRREESGPHVRRIHQVVFALVMVLLLVIVSCSKPAIVRRDAVIAGKIADIAGRPISDATVMVLHHCFPPSGSRSSLKSGRQLKVRGGFASGMESSSAPGGRIQPRDEVRVSVCVELR